MDIPIIFENPDMVVFNKPAGLTVNQAESTKNQETLQGWIKEKYPLPDVKPQNPDQEEFFAKNGIVHRLDKDTSGIVIVAKNPQSYEKLKKQFQAREVVKKYLTLVHGMVEPKEGEINAPIERSPVNRTHFGVFPGGREATTKYKVIKYVQFIKYPKETYSYLELEPKTGRTHQIRVHMKYLGHSIVGDRLYSGRKQLIRDLAICPRMFLHATHLEISGMIFDSPLPDELKVLLH